MKSERVSKQRWFKSAPLTCTLNAHQFHEVGNLPLQCLSPNRDDNTESGLIPQKQKKVQATPSALKGQRGQGQGPCGHNRRESLLLLKAGPHIPANMSCYLNYPVFSPPYPATHFNQNPVFARHCSQISSVTLGIQYNNGEEPYQN